jgi:cytochrome bd-type quinol oxidase subunit 2
MTAYVVAGLLCTIAFGVLIVWAFHGITINSGTNRAKGIADIVRPSAARGTVVAIADWTRQHTRALLLVVSLAVGVALLIHGLHTV